jgi:hypothetical protein
MGTLSSIEKDCYKEFLNPKDVEVFEEPDPEPEDRDLYWEFREIT